MDSDVLDPAHRAVTESILLQIVNTWKGRQLQTKMNQKLDGTQQPFSLTPSPHRSIDVSQFSRLDVGLREAPYTGVIEHNYLMQPMLVLPVMTQAGTAPSEHALCMTWQYAHERASKPSYLVFVPVGDLRDVESVLRDGYFFKHLRLALIGGYLGSSLEIAERVIKRNPGKRSDSDLQLALSIAQEFFTA